MKLLSLLLFFLALLAAQSAPTAATSEKRVDRQLSPSLQPVADVPGLPRVLLLGDSISMGYTLRVRALLAGKANVHRAPTNCGPTIKGLKEIESWLGTGRWDVIHFNFGLHDVKFMKPGDASQQVPPQQYAANLESLTRRLKQTGARLIWATTTPVPPKLKPSQFTRNPDDIPAYNAIAARIMREHGVGTDDLYAAVFDRLPELQNPMDVHFNSQGCDVLAGHVAAAIAAVLPPAAAGEGAATISAKPRIAQVEPRVWSCDFPSGALGGTAMRFLVVLPEGASPGGGTRLPVIYFLHGLGRHESTLLDNPLTRQRVLASPCAVVLPRGKNAWYVNAPAAPADRYADYVDEVIALAEEHFPVGGARQRRVIGGWSAGGYGAAYTAGRRPGDFSAAALIIGILDFPRPAIAEKGQNYTVPERFGADPEVWDRLNPRRLLPRMRGMDFFVAYADQAAERQMNEVFIATARELGVPVEVMRLSGGHTFPMVEAALPSAFAFMERRLMPDRPDHKPGKRD